MRFRCVVFVVVVSTVLVVAGCARKRPTTADRTPEETAVATAPVAGGAAPAAPEAADPLAGDLEAVNAYVRGQGLLGDVHYPYDSWDLSSEARERLADNARFLSRHPQFEVRIEGHCDERGTPEYNLALGERRAVAAQSYLGSMGVGEDRLSTLSYGKERPVCSDPGETCWWRNRRAHFVIAGRRGTD